MNPERWQQIERIYNHARECGPEQRNAFLTEACGDDHNLRREIESLLDHDGNAGQFMEQPAMEVAAKSMARTRPESLAGRSLNHYRIVSFLGAGGMGEVYVASDTKLNRNVAIKILPEAFARDRQRLARFHREAQLLASLNHPRIAAIYGLEEGDGLCGLALELIDGETLAERIARGPVPVDEALGIARQIAEALEAAHAKGVVHRDLKPANIKMTRDGAVKVLDFGLAKIFDSGSPSSDLPTKASLSTEDNVILGTVGYMSPEQARGKDVDKRTDIWAWGCVLYEMLTGHRAFDGSTTTDVIVKIATQEPDWLALPEATPASIRTLLRRSLQKDPNRRLQDVGDARIEIDESFNAQVNVIQSPRGNRNRLAWTVAALAVIVAVVSLAIAYMRSVGRDDAIVRFTVLPPKAVFDTGGVAELAISPNGRYLAFAAYDNTFRLWIRPIDAAEAKPLPGTEGASGPFWSPDSKFIGFGAGEKFKKVAVDGGTPELLSEGYGGYGAWNRDGVILIQADGSGIRKVSSSGGSPTPVTSLGQQETRHGFPFFLPDGRHFLFMVASPQAEIRGVYVGSLDSKERKQVLDVATFTIYADGHLLWVQCPMPDVNCEDGKLMAQQFDASRLEKQGNPFPVAEGAGRNGWLGSLSASNNGVLVYGGPSLHGAQLMWFDRTGRALGIVGQVDFPGRVRLSPDSKRVVLNIFKPLLGTHDILLGELASGIFSPLTFAPSSETTPIWSPEGEVAFTSNRNDAEGIYVKKLGGTTETLLTQVRDAEIDDWSQDGRYIVYHNSRDRAAYALRLFGDRQSELLLQDSFEKSEFKLSADGRWIAYNSNVSGKTEVYVAAFPSMTEKRQVSNAGGGIPRWRRDSKELYYLSADGKLMAVDVIATSTKIETGVPRMLFPTRIVATESNLAIGKYDVSGDGQKFLLLQPDPNSSSPPITVVINWLAALKKN